MWPLFILIPHFLLAEATASLVNVALLKGQTLTYRCNTSFERTFHNWYTIPVGTNIERIIYSKSGLNGEYVDLKRTQVDNASLVLTISSIQLNDAGIYGCKTLNNSTTMNRKAQVIVIESNLKMCHDEASRLTCEVTYRGNFGPVIEWTNDESNQPTKINSTLRNESDGNGNRRLTLTTNSVNSTITCKLYFKNLPTNADDNMSTNRPTYMYTDQCNSSDCCKLSTVDDSAQQSECNNCGNSSSGMTFTGIKEMPYTLLAAIIGSFLFVLIIVVFGLILEKKRVFKKTELKTKKKRSKPVGVTGPDIVQNDDTLNEVIEGMPQQTSLPVYAHIVSDDSDYLSPDESQTANQNRFIASDGTEYLIMNTMQADGTLSPMTPVAPISSMFNSMHQLSIYASIDHTIQPHDLQAMTQPQSPGSQSPSMGKYRHLSANQPPIPSPRNISRKN